MNDIQQKPVLIEIRDVSYAYPPDEGEPDLVLSHVNSYTKPSLGNQIPVDLFVRKYGDESVFEIEAGLGRAPGVQFSIPFEVSRPGLYAFDWLYSNGNGEIETQNKCAVRSLYLDGIYCGPVVLPQRGVDNWTERGWSNSLKARVTGGAHKLEIRYPEENVNMNIDIDTARVHRLRLTRLSK